MIGKSDLIILGVATVALTVGVGRWYSNTRSVESVTIPASARSSIEADRNAARDEKRFNGFVHVGEIADDRNRTMRLPAQATRSNSESEPTGAASTQAAAASNQPEPEKSQYGVHTVKPGDYLGLLANRYETSVGELQALNDIDGTTIHVGDQLRYPQNVR